MKFALLIVLLSAVFISSVVAVDSEIEIRRARVKTRDLERPYELTFDLIIKERDLVNKYRCAYDLTRRTGTIGGCVVTSEEFEDSFRSQIAQLGNNLVWRKEPFRASHKLVGGLLMRILITRDEPIREFATLDFEVNAEELEYQEEEGAHWYFTPRNVRTYNSRNVLRYQSLRPQWRRIE